MEMVRSEVTRWTVVRRREVVRLFREEMRHIQRGRGQEDEQKDRASFEAARAVDERYLMGICRLATAGCGQGREVGRFKKGCAGADAMQAAARQKKLEPASDPCGTV